MVIWRMKVLDCVAVIKIFKEKSKKKELEITFSLQLKKILKKFIKTRHFFWSYVYLYMKGENNSNLLQTTSLDSRYCFIV